MKDTEINQDELYFQEERSLLLEDDLWEIGTGYQNLARKIAELQIKNKCDEDMMARLKAIELEIKRTA